LYFIIIYILLSFIIVFLGAKAGVWALRKTSPAFMERCIKVASPRVPALCDIPAAALDKKVFHFNQLSFPIVQFKRSFFMDFF